MEELRTTVPSNPAYMPIYIATGVMGIIFFIVPAVIPRGPHQGLIRCSVMLTAVSMWLFWITIYIAQINPLLGPRLDNATLAWVGHCWGNDPKTAGSAPAAPAAAPGAAPAAAPAAAPEPAPAAAPEPAAEPAPEPAAEPAAEPAPEEL